MLTIPTRKRRPILPRCPNCGKYRRPAMPRKPRPWWRGGDVLGMAAGDVMLSSTGDRILDASGNLQLSDGGGDTCCCGGSICCLFQGNACGGSTSGVSTTNFIITFSGTIVCANTCFNCSTVSTVVSYEIVGPTTIDGTYCLTNVPNLGPVICRWTSSPIPGFTGNVYAGNTTCSGTPTFTSTDLVIQVDTDCTGHFEFSVSFPNTSSVIACVFESNATSVGPVDNGICDPGNGSATSLTASNVLACTSNPCTKDHTGRFSFGHGGTGTIVRGC